MSISSDFTHDEDGYVGLSYNDFLHNFSYLFKDNEGVGTFDTKSNLNDQLPDSIKQNFTLNSIRQTAMMICKCNKILLNHRRLIWGYFLGVYNEDNLVDLVNKVILCRSNYWKLVDYHSKLNTMEKIQKLDPQIFHPLAPIETNPWAMSQRCKELMDEIWQDIERTYQERSLFQRDQVRKSLQTILYTWSMEHKYISYKQGMNELLAIIYIVCYRDQIACTNKLLGNNNINFEILCSSNLKDIEADSYTLFNSLMSIDLQLMFDISLLNCGDVDNGVLSTIKLKFEKYNDEYNPLIARCNHIYHDLLKKNDLMLYAHLKSIELEPHLFLMYVFFISYGVRGKFFISSRWIRLLFSREFNVNETLNLWDIIFADNFLNLKDDNFISLKFIDYFAVAMLIFVRENLLENDINYCLQRLFKYPPIEDISHLAAKANEVKKSDVGHLGIDDGGTKEVVHLLTEDGRSSVSIDDTPRSIIIQVLDECTRVGDLDGIESKDSGKSIEKNLVKIASKLYKIYNLVTKLNIPELSTLVKDVHDDVTNLLSNQDSL